MAGRGPAPKLPGERRRRNMPERGEWTVLPAEPYEGSKPNLPRVSGGLLKETKYTWIRWWESPMAHMWIESQWADLTRAIRIEDTVARMLAHSETKGIGTLLIGLDRLKKSLGLTEPGRRDLRWLLPTEAEELAEVHQLHVVEPKRRVKAVDPKSAKKKA
ncbi:MAG: hypothetical protein P1T08_12855 [Acidimicrobiia bacterium]|nr:hypothetical protein [Acidimicrobiia bacterium]